MTRRGLGALAGLLLVIGGAVALTWSRGVGPFAPTQDDAAAAPGARAPGHVTDGAQPTDAALAAAGRRTSTRDADRPAGAAAAARPTTLRVFVTVNDLPRAGVTVRVRRWNTLEVLATKETDAEGACEFPSTDLQVVEVEAWAAGLCPCGAGNTELERDTNVVRLDMRPGREVVGRVIDAASGAPVAGASVLVNEVEIGPTAADGRFRLSGVEPGVATEVTADHVGFAPRTIRVRAAPPDVAEPPLELALERCAVITGIVRDPDGHPVPFALVGLAADDPTGRLPSPTDDAPLSVQEETALARRIGDWDAGVDETRTADDGSFSLEVPTGRSTVWLLAVERGYGPSRVAQVDVPNAMRPVVLRLRPTAGLQIEVVGPRGPCTSASVQLLQAWLLHADVGADVTFDDLSDEPAWLYVSTRRLRPVLRRVVPVPGATTRVTVSLDEGRSVEGQVVDESGAPLADAHVFGGDTEQHALLPASPGQRVAYSRFPLYAATNSDGRFRLTGLGDGACFLGASARDEHLWSRSPVRAVPGSSPVRIVVSRRPSVRARFVTATGARFADDISAKVRIQGSATTIAARAGRDESEPCLEFSRIDDGNAVLVAYTPGHAWVTRAFVVRGNTDIDLGTITFQPGTRVVGRVTDRGGRPVDDCHIISTACRYAFALDTSDTSDVHGRFALDDFPPPPFDLELYGEHILSARVRIAEVPADGLRLVVTRRGRVRGQVVDADGAPAVERLFYLRRVGADAAAEEKADPDTEHDDPWQAVVSGPDGRFEHPVEPGTWAVRTDDDEAEASPALQTFTITDGETRDVRIVWPAGAPK